MNRSTAPTSETELRSTETAAFSHMAVVGLGYVGLPLSMAAVARGVAVIGIDTSEEVVGRLTVGHSTVDDVSDAELQEALGQKLFSASSDWTALAQAEAVLICVPTPVADNHLPDLSCVEAATRAVAENLVPGQLVVLESTVNPGVSESVVVPLLEEVSGLRSGKDFFYAYCPERVDPGNAIWKLHTVPRVIGAADQKSLARARTLYEQILAAPVHSMQNLQEAESVKILENTFRDVNIAFINEMARSFAVLGIDIKNVIEGAATKPYGFMPFYPRCGIGGHCIPVDPYYLIEYAKQQGFEHAFLRLAREINNGMPAYTVDLVRSALAKDGHELAGSEVAVLGLSYKPDIADLRESPALAIVELLTKAGAHVRSFDPYLLEQSTHTSLAETLKDAQACVLATAHREFTMITPEHLRSSGVTSIVDGYNVLDKEAFQTAGLHYVGIGR